VNRTEYESRTEALLAPFLAEMNFELVDVEFVKEAGTWYLRAYIDKDGGITVDDCEAVSRRLDEQLDAEDFIEESYVLEVSSPGLGRPVRKERDFVRNEGYEVDVRLYKPFEQEKEWRGVLCAWDRDTVTIRTQDEREITWNRKDIALIRESFEL